MIQRTRGVLRSYLLSLVVAVADSCSEEVCNREHRHFKMQQCLVSTGNKAANYLIGQEVPCSPPPPRNVNI